MQNEWISDNKNIEFLNCENRPNIFISKIVLGESFQRNIVIQSEIL